MWRGAVCAICVVFVIVALGDAQQHADLQEIVRKSLLNKWEGAFNEVDKSGNVGFSWSDCSSSKDPPVKVKSLSLGPNPLRIPGNITLATEGEVKIDITSPIELDLEVKKKVLFWIKIPCVDNIGSCNYPDICPMLVKAFPTCPPEFTKYGIPCHCPVKKGSYSLPSTSMYVNVKEAVPAWLEKGQYEAEARLKQNGNELFCMRINLSIEPSK